MNERFQERVERKLGELTAKVDIILSEIKSMKNNISNLTERITRCEDRIDDCEDKINNHLEWHKREKGWSIQWRIAVLAALVASVSSFLLNLLAKVI